MAKRVKLGNQNYLDSTSIVHKEKTLKNILERSYLIATIKSNIPISINSFDINLNEIYDSVGNDLTLENGKIKIGNNVSKVRVSGCVFASDWDNRSYFWGTTQKNGKNFNGAISHGETYVSTPIVPIIISVNPNDTISLHVNTYGGRGTIRNEEKLETWLMVEVIE